MGSHDSWLAVKGWSKKALLETLGLDETADTGWAEEVAQPYACAVLPNRWIIVFANFNGLASLENIAVLSQRGMVLACDFQDKVEAPSSRLIAARNGETLWEIGAVGDDLIVTGDPPPRFGPIRDRYAAELARNPEEVYMNELPFELAEELCGYRHDESEVLFQGLRPKRDSHWHRGLQLVELPRSRIPSIQGQWTLRGLWKKFLTLLQWAYLLVMVCGGAIAILAELFAYLARETNR